MRRLKFLVASKRALFLHCGASMAVFIGTLGLNLFAAGLAINRKILLKDTGRKLSHFDKQMQAESPEGLPPFLAERRERVAGGALQNAVKRPAPTREPQ